MFLAAILLRAQSPDASPAPKSFWDEPAAPINDLLPHWMRFGGEERVRGEGTLGLNFRPFDDRYLLQRLRLNLEILPTEWLRFDFQGQDARALGRLGPQTAPFRDAWDLRQAVVTVGSLERYHVQVRLGRQELAFGDERLIGISNWINASRVFDGYRATFRDKRVQVDAFAASEVMVLDGDIGHHTPGDYVEGVYVDLPKLIPQGRIQPYFFWRRSPGMKLASGAPSISHLGTYGFRWVGKLPRGFSYNTETAWQRGSLDPTSPELLPSDHISAWATHLQMKYDLPFLRNGLKPQYVVEYNYASGTGDPSSREHGTFDTLYASGHDKIELADQVGWRNVEAFRTGPDVRTWLKGKLSVRYADLWLADAHDSLYAANGRPVVTRANGSAGRWVGQEFSATWTVPVNKRSELGAGYAYLLPGTFLKITTPGKPHSYPFLYFQTSF